MGINSTALTTELLSQILRLNMQQSNRKTTVLCNGNNWSFNISSSSVDRPVERAILAGALTECDHWFVQQELKSDKFNSPSLKLGKTRNAKEMRHSAAGERERDEKFTTFNHSQHVLCRNTLSSQFCFGGCVTSNLSCETQAWLMVAICMWMNEMSAFSDCMSVLIFSSWERKQLLGGYITLVNIPML